LSRDFSLRNAFSYKVEGEAEGTLILTSIKPVLSLSKHHRARWQGHEGSRDPAKRPDALVLFLQEHLQRVKLLHEGDLAQGYGSVHFACPMPWNATIPTLPKSGCGNTSFHRIACRWILALKLRAAIT
jgi:hypothetical protein